MTSPLRSFAREEAAATSPYRHPFASSSSPKPSHSPFLSRRTLASADGPQPRVRRSNDYLPSPQTRAPDAISTSSSTLVNAESASDYRLWEVRSSSSESSLASARISVDGRVTPTLSALDDLGTLPSIDISPLLTRRTRPRASLRSAASVDRTRTRQVCPDDCRCSDQDIDLGLCRRAAASSSSGSEPGSLSVGMHVIRPREPYSDPIAATMTSMDGGVPYDQSHHSSHSASEARSHSRDFDKDPVLVPKSARARLGARTPQHSFDQLQRGLDTLESSDSADSDADHSRAAKRRAESMARWTARRSTLEPRPQPPDRRQPTTAPRSPDPKQDRSAPTAMPSPAGPGSGASPLRRTPAKLSDEPAEKAAATPLMVTPSRKSIAAVFESMQKEREARAAEEHRQWQEKQARRERERAARAFGVPARRRTSATSSQLDSPASYSSLPERASPGGSRAARSPVSGSVSASPVLSGPGSPQVDEHAASDVQPRYLGEEASPRIPETLAEADEESDLSPGIGKHPDVDRSQESENTRGGESERQPSTPQTQQTAFGFASQPMALDLSPVRSLSAASSPASSPRKGAHRRQNTNTVSVASNLPSASLGAARQRLNHILRSNPAPEPQDAHAAEEEAFAYPQTPISGILSSAKKGAAFSAGRRGHSVRFSPRPDYRSDSGSWDESTQAANDEADSREAAVSRLLLPAQPIRIPDLLQSASASPPRQPAEEPQAMEDPAPAKEETAGGLHTALFRAEEETEVASVSQSVRFPGAYARTPVKTNTFSRHIIRASPKNPRVLPPTMTAGRGRVEGEFGLFPGAGAEIPRESTPPPIKPERGAGTFLPPDDPRNSPRSPRPASLGREAFASFEAGGSDDSVGSNVPQPDESLQVTVSKMLATMQTSAEEREKRGRLGEAIKAVGERVTRVEGMRPQWGQPVRVSRGEHAVESVLQAEQHDQRRVEELRVEVAQALAVLADRIVQLHQTQANLPSPTPEVGSGRWSRWRLAMMMVVQCMLLAYLMSLAERKAHRMRMFNSPVDLRHLYNPGSSHIEWDSPAHDIHLTPILAIPGLANLAATLPPLPSPAMLRLLPNHPGSSIVQLYTAYIRLNGFHSFAIQITLYTIAQLIAYLLILLSAPLHVLWLITHPASF